MPDIAARRALWAGFRADDRQHGPWATVLSHQFGLADILYHMGECPPEWRFRHSPAGGDCLADMLACGHHEDVSHVGECECDWPALGYLPYADYPPALAYAGEVLSRYRRRWLCDTCETRRSECSCD